MTIAQQIKAKYHNQIEVGSINNFCGECMVSAEYIDSNYDENSVAYTFSDGSKLKCSTMPKMYAGVRVCNVSVFSN